MTLSFSVNKMYQKPPNSYPSILIIQAYIHKIYWTLNQHYQRDSVLFCAPSLSPPTPIISTIQFIHPKPLSDP